MARVAIGESALLSEFGSDFAPLRTFFQVAEERGHPAPSVVVDELGRPITHFDYDDMMGTFHHGANSWAFCRRIRADALGLVAGTDWVRAHSMHLLFTTGSPYLPEPHFAYQLYTEDVGGAGPAMLQPLIYSNRPAWNHAGTHLAVLEHISDEDISQPGTFLVWQYEIASGLRELVATFGERRLGGPRVAYSPDDRWLLVSDPFEPRTLLIGIGTGRIIDLELPTFAVDWNPAAGPSHLAYVPLASRGQAHLVDLDLETGASTTLTTVKLPMDTQTSLRELAMSADGQRALLTAPVGGTALQLARRGGVHVAAIIDVESASISPVLDRIDFKTPGADRRHVSPTWVEASPRSDTPTTIEERLLEAAEDGKPGDDGVERPVAHAKYWRESLDGIEEAWRTDRLPPGHFGEDYAQLAAAIAALAPEVGAEIQDRRADLRARFSAIRVVEDRIDRLERGVWPGRAPADILRMAPAVTLLPPAAADDVVPAEDHTGLRDALEAMIGAFDTTSAQVAASRLISSAKGRDPWQELATIASRWLRDGDYVETARAALAAYLWGQAYVPRLGAAGTALLEPCPPEVERRLMIDGFQASVRLPERDRVGGDATNFFDARQVRQRCQERIEALDATEVVLARGTSRAWEAGLVLRREEQQLASAWEPIERVEMEAAITQEIEAGEAGDYAFISYVREDAETVARLIADLNANGIRTWQDVTAITPADRFRRKIRRAIKDGAHFVACFSSRSQARYKTEMRWEVDLAIGEMLRRDRDDWFFALKLDECDIPDTPINAVETLHDLSWQEMFPDWDAAIARIVSGMRGG